MTDNGRTPDSVEFTLDANSPNKRPEQLCSQLLLLRLFQLDTICCG